MARSIIDYQDFDDAPSLIDAIKALLTYVQTVDVVYVKGEAFSADAGRAVLIEEPLSDGSKSYEITLAAQPYMPRAVPTHELDELDNPRMF